MQRTISYKSTRLLVVAVAYMAQCIGTEGALELAAVTEVRAEEFRDLRWVDLALA